AGVTVSEAVCRGLQVYLDEQLRNRVGDQQNTIFHMPLGTIEDQHCRFYLNALTTLNDVPTIGVAEELFGFPVIGVRSNDRWHIRVGLNTTLALRNALKQALFDTQNQLDSVMKQKMEASVFLKEMNTQLDIPSCDEITQLEVLESSIQVLNRNGKHLLVYDLAFEPFLKQELAGVFGVQVCGEVS
ncbi:MAG TPA: bacteriocin maturation protein, partial [Pseudoneobacillus sp.]|nr:bacteriocin maturation protein [Pseudoneobacillus sp.]